jgi:hypothetical protein
MFHPGVDAENARTVFAWRVYWLGCGLPLEASGTPSADRRQPDKVKALIVKDAVTSFGLDPTEYSATRSGVATRRTRR